VDDLRYDLAVETASRDEMHTRLMVLEVALNALLADIAYNPALAAEMARHELDRLT
jgi:hypothetical protein